MTNNFIYYDFYEELKTELPTSLAIQRKRWAFFIIENKIDIKALSILLQSDKKTGLRYAWLLSEIGQLNADSLFAELPYLLKLSEQIDHFYFIESFATYWLIAGVPNENESQAIELLFGWVLSNEINVTTKFRALQVLVQLCNKFPELKNELFICLEDQEGKQSKDFEKKIKKVLIELKTNCSE